MGTGNGGRAAAETIDFTLTVAAAGRQDVVRRSVPLLPYGMPVYATATGSADSDTTFGSLRGRYVTTRLGRRRNGRIDKGMTLANPTLSILVGPTIERSLLDVLFGAGAAMPTRGRPDRLGPGDGHQRPDGRHRAAKAAERDPAGLPEAQELDARIRQTVSLLGAAQNDDGGWGWTDSGAAAAIAMPRRGPSGH